MTRTCQGLMAIVITVLAFGSGGQACGGDPITGEGKLRNPRPAWPVRIIVDKPDRIYHEGEKLTIKVKSVRRGYVYVFNIRADGKCVLIFPNQFEQEKIVEAGQEVCIPGEGADYVFRIRPPFGRERLLVVVSLERLDIERFAKYRLRQEVFREVDLGRVKSVCTELNLPEWAEHEIEIETRPAGGAQKQIPLRRIALLTGVGKFANSHPILRELRAPEHDVAKMKEFLESEGRMYKVMCLVNEEATAEAIRTAICVTLPAMTSPGDEVLIYFSGHGGRCADEGGDEEDGYDEYLVPYDAGLAVPLPGAASTPQSVVLDDEFARWIQELDGRRVVVIVDACYGGGYASEEKGLPLPGPAAGGQEKPERGHFDFLDDIDRELSLIKDLGAEIALLASSHADQVSLECREEPLSVMTRFLLEYCRREPRPVSLRQAWDYVREKVPEYVSREFGGRYVQCPRLTGEEVAATFLLKP